MLDALPFDVFCNITRHLSTFFIVLSLQVNRKLRTTIAMRNFWSTYLTCKVSISYIQRFNYYADFFDESTYHPAFVLSHFLGCLSNSVFVKCVIPKICKFKNNYDTEKRHVTNSFIQSKKFLNHLMQGNVLHGYDHVNYLRRIDGVLSYINSNGKWEIMFRLHPTVDSILIDAFTKEKISIQPKSDCKSEILIFEFEDAQTHQSAVRVLAVRHMSASGNVRM